MAHLLATCRTIRTIAMLSFAILALAVLSAMPVAAHAPIVHAQTMQTMLQQHEHHHHGAMGAATHHNTHSHATHAAMAHCCHDEPADTAGIDCAAVCAAMAGCQLQMMPGDGLIDIVPRDAAPIIGQPAFQAEFSAAPATPPPKART
ncbi:MAG: hypothetical protein JJU21_16245 [Salinarimonas sp.]|nr:hypothetical protein [Salinarimonas sp.]